MRAGSFNSPIGGPAAVGADAAPNSPDVEIGGTYLRSPSKSRLGMGMGAGLGADGERRGALLLFEFGSRHGGRLGADGFPPMTVW